MSDQTITVDQAVGVLNRDYFEDVRGIADDLKRAVKDGEITSEEEFYTYLDESCDGHQRVIYTFRARLGLISTDNLEAYESEFGEKPPTVEAQMYAALRADVMARCSYDDIVSELDEEKEKSEGRNKPGHDHTCDHDVSLDDHCEDCPE